MAEHQEPETEEGFASHCDTRRAGGHRAGGHSTKRSAGSVSDGDTPEGDLPAIVPAAGRFTGDTPCIAAVVLCGVAFMLLLAWVSVTGITPLDVTAISFVLSVRSDTLTSLMTQITYLAMPIAMIALSFGVAPFVAGRYPWLVMLVNIGGSALLNTALKYLICRTRPDQELWLMKETGYSFPSGHAMAAMSFYGFIIWLVLRQDRFKGGKNWSYMIWIAGLSAVIVAIGMSRVYLCVHYATDVFSGYAVSLAWLIIYTRFFAPAILGPVPAERSCTTELSS